jgi:hypothetical protein
MATLLPHWEVRMKIGDHVTPSQLKKAGYELNTDKGDMSYWFSPIQLHWIKVVDGKVVKIFTE